MIKLRAISVLTQKRCYLCAFISSCIILISSCGQSPSSSHASTPSGDLVAVLSTNGNTAVADGINSIELQVFVQDSHLKPIGDVNVSLATTGTHNIISIPSGTTDSNGLFISSIRSTAAQTKILTALVDNTITSNNASVMFIAGEPNIAVSKFTANPTSVVADGISFASISTQLLDAYANPVGNTAISLTTNNSNSTFVLDANYPAAMINSSAQICSAYTDINGLFVVDFVSLDVGTVLVNVDSDAHYFSATTRVNFTQAAASGEPNLLLSSFVVSPNTQIANGHSSAALLLHVVDAAGVAIANQAMTFSSNSNLVVFTNNTVSASCITNNNGFCSASVYARYPVVATITATFTSGNANALIAQVSFLQDIPTATASSFVTNTNIVIADGVSTAQLIFFAGDTNGYPVAGAPVTLLASGLNYTINHSTGATDQNGFFNASITSTSVGNKTISATFGNNQTLGVGINFIAGPPSVAYSTLQAVSNNATADGNSNIWLALTLYDARNNLITMPYQVSFVSSNSGDVFSASNGNTTNGVFNTSLTSTQIGTRTITATFNGLTLTTNVSFVSNNIVSTSLSRLMVNPNVLTANNQSEAMLIVDVVDTYGNPIANQPVTFTATPSSGTTLLYATGYTDNYGEFSSALYSALAGIKTLKAFVGNNHAVLSDTADVTFVAGSATQLSFLVPPSITQVGNTINPAVQVALLDSYNNNVNDSRLVSLSVNNNVAILSGTLSRYAVNGIATFDDLSINTAGTAYQLVASANDVSQVASSTFNITSQATPCLVFIVQPNNTVSNSNISPVVVVQLPNYTGIDAAVTLSLNSNVAGAVLSGTTEVLTSQGNAVFGALQIATSGTGYALYASSPNYTSATSQNFNIVAGPIDVTMSSFSATPNSQIANYAAQSLLRLFVSDHAGNPVNNQSVVLSSSDSNDAIGAINYSNQANGIYTAYIVSSVAGIKNLTAHVGSSNFITSITFVAGLANANNALLTINPNTLTTDSNTLLSLVLYDSFYNRVANTGISLSSNGIGDTFIPASGLTDSNGIFMSTIGSSSIGTKTITASFNTGSVSKVVNFLAGSPNTINSSFTVSPNSLVANGASTSNLIVLVEDASGNPVANQYVTLGVYGSNNTLTINSNTTDSNGRYTATLASTKAETKGLQVSFGGISPLNQTIAFVPGAAASLLFLTNPTSEIAGVVINPNIQVEAVDGYSNVVSNFNSLVTLSLSPSATLFGTISSNANQAIAIFNNLQVHQAYSNYLLQATSNFINGNSTAFSVIAASPNATNSNFYASPSTLVADGSISTLLTLNIVDVYGNPTSNQNGQITVISGGNTTLLQNSNTTDANGNITATLVSTTEQTVTLQALFAGNATLNTNVVFVAGNANATNSNFYTSSNSLTADGTSAATLTLVVLDTYGNAVKNQAISITSSGTSNNLVCNNNITNASGIVTATLKSTKAETKVVQAHFGSDLSVVLQQNIIYTAGDANAANANFYASPDVVVANGFSHTNLVLTLLDTYANPIADETIHFLPVDGNNIFSSNTCTTNANGSCSVSLASTIIGNHAITAGFSTGNPNYLTTNISFVERIFGASASSFVLSQRSTVGNCNDANQFMAFKLNIRDTGNNPYPNQSVVFSSSDANSTLNPNAGITDANGVISTYLNTCTHGVVTVTADVNGYVLQANAMANTSHPVIPFLPGAPDITMSHVVGLDTYDFNNDGYLDLVMISSDGTIQTALADANGTGTFLNVSNYSATGAGAAVAVGAYCTNHGFFCETEFVATYAAAIYSNSDNLDIFSIDQNGIVAYSNSYNLGGINPISIVIASFNPDSTYANIVVVDSLSNSIGILFGNNDGTFQNIVPYAVGAGPKNIAIADFNGDGNQDIAVTNQNDNTISILLYQNANIFYTSGTYPTGSMPLGIAAADFNQDGNIDIAITNSNDNTLSILINQGNAIFPNNNPITYATGNTPFGVAVGTFESNANGYLAVTNYTDNTMGLFVGDGAGNFSSMYTFASTGYNPTQIVLNNFNTATFTNAVVVNPGSQTVSVILANPNSISNSNYFYGPAVYHAKIYPGLEFVVSGFINNDAYADILAVGNSGLAIFLGYGDGTFLSTPISVPQACFSYSAAVIADFDQDGNQDIALPQGFQSQNDNVTVLLGNGDATFQNPTYYPVGDSYFGFGTYIAAGNLNGDAYPDIVVSNTNDNTISVLLNNGSGGFLPANNYVVSSNALAYQPSMGLAIAALQGDANYQDIVVANPSDQGIAVFYNDGSGGFNKHALACGEQMGYVVVNDLDGDNYLDIVAASLHQLYVFLSVGGNANFLSTPTHVINVGGCTLEGLATSDINQDGYQDLIWSDHCPGTDLGINLGMGNGLFNQTPLYYNINVGDGQARPRRSVSIADFNGDSLPDITVSFENNGGDFPVLLNQP